jgi:hypothetical protein
MVRLPHLVVILALATAAFWSGWLHAANGESSGSGDLTQVDAVFRRGLRNLSIWHDADTGKCAAPRAFPDTGMAIDADCSRIQITKSATSGFIFLSL